MVDDVRREDIGTETMPSGDVYDYTNENVELEPQYAIHTLRITCDC